MFPAGTACVNTHLILQYLQYVVLTTGDLAALSTPISKEAVMQPSNLMKLFLMTFWKMIQLMSWWAGPIFCLIVCVLTPTLYNILEKVCLFCTVPSKYFVSC